jgi:hypothetical protein
VITGLVGYEVVLEDLGQNRYEVATDYVNAYSFEQIQPFTARRAAQQRYLEIFFAHARKDDYALWHDNHWITVTAEGAERPWDRKTLTSDIVLRHANHTDILRGACGYMIDSGKKVSLGETMATSARTMFRFAKAEPIPGQDNHYATERWQIVEIECQCEECGADGYRADQAATK